MNAVQGGRGEGPGATRRNVTITPDRHGLIRVNPDRFEVYH